MQRQLNPRVSICSIDMQLNARSLQRRPCLLSKTYDLPMGSWIPLPGNFWSCYWCCSCVLCELSWSWKLHYESISISMDLMNAYNMELWNAGMNYLELLMEWKSYYPAGSVWDWWMLPWYCSCLPLMIRNDFEWQGFAPTKDVCSRLDVGRRTFSIRTPARHGRTVSSVMCHFLSPPCLGHRPTQALVLCTTGR